MSRVTIWPRAKGASLVSKLMKAMTSRKSEVPAPSTSMPMKLSITRRIQVMKKAMTWLSVSAEMSRPMATAAAL